MPTLKAESKLSDNDQAELCNAELASSDAALASFLDFLDRDMVAHPERICAFDDDFVNQVRTLTAGVTVDLDAPLAIEAC